MNHGRTVQLQVGPGRVIQDRLGLPAGDPKLGQGLGVNPALSLARMLDRFAAVAAEIHGAYCSETTAPGSPSGRSPTTPT